MFRRTLACALCAILAASFAPRIVLAQQQQTQQTQQDAPISAAQLDSLVAPIALYPDPLLAQVLAASTYPLELVQLQQWLAQNPSLKDQALVDAVSQQNWDPSVQSMAPLPDVVKLLASDIKWVTDLGNAFLAQQDDVMQAVQRMRQKASSNGKLASSERLKVENKSEGGETVIVIEQSDPQTVYVPSYNPTVVYGEPAYAYPAVAYPPIGYYAAGAAISFGVGVAMGAAFHGGWGYGCGWGGGGHNEININRQNNFQQRNSARTGNVGSGNKWQHNPQHRGGTPYGNRATNDRFGGSQRNARAGMDRGGAGDRGGLGGGDRGALGGDRGGNRGGDRGGIGGGDRGGARGGGDRVGNRSVGSGNRSGGNSALGSGNRSGGYNGQAARQSSNRGSASRGSASRSSGRSGGASRGGGSRGGGRGGGRR